jgi:TP901 family phage tail tape measure protein
MAKFEIKVSASLSKESAKRIQDDLDKLGKKTSKEFNQTKKNVVGVNKELKKTSQGLTDIFSKVATWSAITGLFFGMQRSLKDIVKQVAQLDASLVEFNKVANTTSSELESITKEAFDMSKGLASTGRAVIDAATEFIKAGESIEDSMQLAEQAIILQNVADGVDSIGESAGALISVMKAFDIKVKDSARIVDILNEVSNTSAVGFSNLVEMIQKSAGVLEQADNTFEESVALLSGAFEILRDESVATSLNTISLRLRGISEATGDFDGELFATLAESFERIAGIKIEDETGLRSTFEIIKDLAEKAPELSEIELGRLIEQAAGKRQAKAISALIKNWDSVEDSVLSATNSMGSALKEQEVFINSVQGRLNILSSAWQKLAQNTVDSDTLKWFIDFGTATVELVDELGLGNIALSGLIVLMPKIVTGLQAVNAQILIANAQLALWALAIVAVTQVVDILITTNEELSDSIIGSFNAIDRNIDKLNSLINKYKDLHDADDITALQRIELAGIEQELASRYGITTNMLEGQVDMTRILIEAKRAELATTLEQQEANYDEAQSRLAVIQANNAEYLSLLQLTDITKEVRQELEGRIKDSQEEIELLKESIVVYEKQQSSLKEIDKIIQEMIDGTYGVANAQKDVNDETQRSIYLREQEIKLLEKQKELLKDFYDEQKLIHEDRIDGWEDEIDALERQQDAIERRREDEEMTNKLIEARQRLLNAQTQKNVWTFMGEDMGWQLTADPRAVKEAAEALDEQLKLQKELQEDRILEDQIQILKDKIDNEKDLIKELKRSIDAQIKALDNRIDIIINNEQWQKQEQTLNNVKQEQTQREQTQREQRELEFKERKMEEYSDVGFSDAIADDPFRDVVAGKPIPQFAVGTSSAPGGLSMVHQDELVNLPRGSGVLTKNETQNMRAFGQDPLGMLSKLLPLVGRDNGGGTGDTIYKFENFTIKADDIDEFIDSIALKVPSFNKG